jgi:hypothetical protein
MVASMLAYQINLITLDWPLGGALAVTLLALTLGIVWVGQKFAMQLAAGRGVGP